MTEQQTHGPFFHVTQNEKDMGPVCYAQAQEDERTAAMSVCRWIRDPEVPGGRYFVPECICSASGGFCCCPTTRRSLEERIEELENKVTELTATNGQSTHSVPSVTTTNEGKT